jgi:Peptidase family M28
MSMTRTPKLFHSALLAAVAAAVAAAFSANTAAGAPGPRHDVIEESAVRAHMGFLASDAMNGRGSGTRDEWITATYIAAQLRRIGLEPLGDGGDYVQAIEIARTEVVGAPTLNIGSTTLIHGDQMVVMKLNSAALRGPLQKYDANTPVQAGAALLMPEGADPHPAENFFARSDNIALARRGVVAQTVSSFGLHADYHQPSDDIAHIDFAHMTAAIQSLLLPVRWLADSAFRPEWTAGGRPH